MSPVLFWDATCQRPYDGRSLAGEALGGTESSLIRVAGALDARVVQHNRTVADGRFLPPARIADVRHLVVNRDPRVLPALLEHFPDARFLLWLHDQIRPGSKRGRRLAGAARQLAEMQVEIVCVSEWQRAGVLATLRETRHGDRIRVHVIHNPVDPALAGDGSDIDPDKLVFFSSPNKGLKFALDAFRALRRRIPGLRLLVGNPGYKRDLAHGVDGVSMLGPQPQARIHQEVRSALCTFAPNFVLPETFGLVFAESLALGTPVLGFDCGAAREVIGDPRQLVPVSSAHRAYEALLGAWPSRLRRAPSRVADGFGLFDEFAARVQAWRAGSRPKPAPDPRFKLDVVAAQWRELLAL
jgi:glycosyltransferase involved in cell wall biosynthesis